MKKICAINGSPRKDGNTARLLKQALAGAERAGAETCLIQLGELKFSGCRSCFACKRLDHPAEQCVIKDDLTPFLSGLRHADGRDVVTSKSAILHYDLSHFPDFLLAPYFLFCQLLILVQKQDRMPPPSPVSLAE